MEINPLIPIGAKIEVNKSKIEKLLPNNRYGIVSKVLNWLPLSNDENLEREVYIVHFEPDSSSNFHRHNGYEEFYVIDGELMEDDGKVFKKVDYIKFEKVKTVVNTLQSQKLDAPF